MADFPTPPWPPLNVINPWSLESLGLATVRLASGPSLASAASGSFVANNVLVYPFRIYTPATAVKMSYVVGGTATGNVDLGIYDWQKNLLVNSGSTAQGSINTLQELDITDTKLLPGRYYMAIQASTTGTRFAITFADELIQPLVLLYEPTPGAFGLPSTLTFVQSATASPAIVAMGVHFDTLV